MQTRFKYALGALVLTIAALMASETPRAEARLLCSQISCTNDLPCDVDACGGVGFCGVNHHCVPE
jgi:hypothetical protein